MNKSIISNKFVRFGISVFSLLYLILTVIMAVWTFLYRIEFTSDTGFYVFYIILSAAFLVLLILSKDQLITRLISMLLPFPVFLLTLFNLSTPVLFVPPLIVALFSFFASEAKDGPKVILGSLYLLLFVVGIVGYSILVSLFGGSSVETRLDYSLTDSEITSLYDMDKIDRLNANSVSPDGKYRYYILDVQDNDRGKVIIVVEPNDLDISYRFFTLIEAGYTSRIAKYPVRGVTPDIEWVQSDEYDPSSPQDTPRYKLRYRFGESSDWKTSTINIPKSKNYLRFMNID